MTPNELSGHPGHVPTNTYDPTGMPGVEYYSKPRPREQPTVGVKGDGDKERWTLVPWDGLEGALRVLEHGARKYSPDNWRKVPDLVERYTNALLRHQTAILLGEDLDPESGLPHAYHVLCNALFLAEVRKQKERQSQ